MNEGLATSTDDGQGAQDPDPDQPPPPEADPPPEAAAWPFGSDQAAQDGQAEIEVLDPFQSGADAAWIRQRLADALPFFGRPAARICVMLVDDHRMTQLHRDHCNVDQTTDVLTFPAAASGGDEPIDVDIAICVDEARRRAAELGHPLKRELLLYAVHGLLHAAGFDDHEEADYRAMHAEEDRILEAIGVGSTFKTGESSGHDDDRPDQSRVSRAPA